MNLFVSQIYPEVGVNYPFTHRFQLLMSQMLTDSIGESRTFDQLYGDNFDLIVRMSAKSGIAQPEIKGPTVYRRDRDVEYTVFIPFRGGAADSTNLRYAVSTLLQEIIAILQKLGFDTARVSAMSSRWVDQIVSDSTMIE